MPDPRLEPKQILAVPSSDMLVQHSPEAASVNSGTLSKEKEIVITFAGGYRFRFALEASATRTAYGQVYKNGAAYGIQRNTTSTAPVIFEEDLAGQRLSVVCWLDDPAQLEQLEQAFARGDARR